MRAALIAAVALGLSATTGAPGMNYSAQRPAKPRGPSESDRYRIAAAQQKRDRRAAKRAAAQAAAKGDTP